MRHLMFHSLCGQGHKTVSINHHFCRERRAEADRTEVLLLTSLAPDRLATPAYVQLFQPVLNNAKSLGEANRKSCRAKQRGEVGKVAETDHTTHPIGWSAYDVTARSSAFFFVLLFWPSTTLWGVYSKKTSDYPFR